MHVNPMLGLMQACVLLIRTIPCFCLLALWYVCDICFLFSVHLVASPTTPNIDGDSTSIRKCASLSRLSYIPL